MSITYFCVIIYLVKDFISKTQWDKTMVKGKRVWNTFLSPPQKDNYIQDEEVKIIFYTGY